MSKKYCLGFAGIGLDSPNFHPFLEVVRVAFKFRICNAVPYAYYRKW